MDKDLDGARIAMTETTNKRPHNRIPIRLEAFYSAGRVEGDGVLADVSYSGALIEDTTIQPEIGTYVVLHVYLEPPSAFEAATPFQLTGRVVRHSSAGFAIEYKDKFDLDVRRVVDDAAAIMAASR